MERGSLEQLKHDIRLRRRKGWISNADSEDYLASLPDAQERVYVPEEDEQETPAAPAEASAAAPTGAPTAAPAPAEEPASQAFDPFSPPFREVSE